MRPTGRTRLSFLYSRDYTEEFDDYRGGRVPAHRLFGAAHLGEFGAEASIYHWPKWWPSGRMRAGKIWRILQAVLVGMDQKELTAVVCATEASALPLLLLCRLGIFRRPVIVLTVAALRPTYSRGPRRVLVSWLLRAAAIVFAFAVLQVSKLVATFRLAEERVRFLPWGVDVDYFPVNVTAMGAGPTVLSVGTNNGKDMRTLMAALTDELDCLVVTDAHNIRVARAHGAPAGVVFRQDVPMSELRELYGSATHVVIPMYETDMSSGQTVLLENLVAGRAVIVSDVSGIVDYTSGTAVITVEPGHPTDLRKLLEAPGNLATPEQVSRARAAYGSRLFTKRLLQSVETVRRH